ncbi:Holliday junction branch migration protein RuvA [Caldicellulosiruptoraceae bacterium PP1]
MIEAINGKVENVYNNIAIVRIGNIYFRMFCNYNKFSKIIGKEHLIYTYLKWVETLGEIELYGFLDKEERELFLKLQKVSGIGSKLALNILSNVPYEKLTIDIAKGVTSEIEKVKGVGKKTAAKIIVELKESFKKEFTDSSENKKTDIMVNSDYEDVKLALYSLGFSKEQVLSVINKLDKDLDVEEAIKQSLKMLSKI